VEQINSQLTEAIKDGAFFGGTVRLCPCEFASRECQRGSEYSAEIEIGKPVWQNSKGRRHCGVCGKEWAIEVDRPKSILEQKWFINVINGGNME